MDEQTEKLLRATLDYAEPRRGRFDDPALRNRRIVALAMLGEQEKALAEWQAYYDAGFGVLSGLIYADDPRFASIVDHPEFQRILEAIRARNTRRMERLMANDFSVDTPL